MSTAPRRPQAPRLARPAARYWKGKAPKGPDAQLDSDGSDVQDEEVHEDVLISDEQDFVRVDQGTEPDFPQVMLADVTASVGKTDSYDEDEDDEEDEYDRNDHPPDALKESEESDDEETESDSDAGKPKLQFRPVFVPKRGRITISEKSILQDSEKTQELQAQARIKQSHDLVAESIKREIAEKEKEELVPDVDDTDGLDPSGEFEAWRLRELERIKQEKEQQVAKDLEREEVERRRALPEEQRLKEDLEKAQKSRAEKPKGQQKFLQKYWHKGAFHQDQDILSRRDYTEATESAVDVSMLPKVMQVKNFGKRSRTKYTHLVDQDTGSFGIVESVKSGGTTLGEKGRCFTCGGPHLKKDCPKNAGDMLARRTGPASGANASATPSESRQWGGERDQRTWSWRERDKDRPFPRDRDYNHDAGRTSRGNDEGNDVQTSRGVEGGGMRRRGSRELDYDDGRARRRSRSRRRSQYNDSEREKRRRLD